MAEAKRPSQVKFLVGAIFASEGILIEAKKRLEGKFGPIDFQSPLIAFNYTKHYEKEMGPNLNRQFLSFQRLIEPQELAALKLYTNRLEKRLSPKAKSKDEVEGANRKINLDPGYISASKLVLASCKNYFHRIYLDKGIFAEITLSFRNKTFTPWSWTYPDYKSKAYIESFNTIREIYLRQLPR